MKKWISLIGISFSLIFLDVLSKYLTYLYVPKLSWFHFFYPYGGIAVFKFSKISLSLNYVENKGAAWGMFENYSTILFILRILIIAAIIFYLIYSNPSFKKGFSFCLILSGAIGNVLDYFIYSHVIDMIHFRIFSYSYPLFNLADIMITIGVFLLLITSFKRKKV